MEILQGIHLEHLGKVAGTGSSEEGLLVQVEGKVKPAYQVRRGREALESSEACPVPLEVESFPVVAAFLAWVAYRREVAAVLFV